MTRYGQKMRQADLREAYRRTGAAFKVQLQQNFILPHDSCPPIVTPWVRGHAGVEMVGSVARTRGNSQWGIVAL
jgi:hypothetical protein